MLRVTKLDEQSATVYLEVEGRITAGACGALGRICRAYLEEGQSVQLDLGGVSSVTPRAVEMLRALQAQPVDLISVPPLAREHVHGRTLVATALTRHRPTNSIAGERRNTLRSELGASVIRPRHRATMRAP